MTMEGDIKQAVGLLRMTAYIFESASDVGIFTKSLKNKIK
jgi:hypothetical protein